MESVYTILIRDERNLGCAKSTISMQTLQVPRGMKRPEFHEIRLDGESQISTHGQQIKNGSSISIMVIKRSIICQYGQAAELTTTLLAKILQPIIISVAHSQLEFIVRKKSRVGLEIDVPICIELL